MLRLVPGAASNLNSLRVPAAKDSELAITTMTIAIFAWVGLTMTLPPSLLPPSLLPILRCNLVERLLLTIRLHQGFACILVVGVFGDPPLCVSNVCVHLL